MSNHCLYNDPSVFVKTEYDQDSPNPGPSSSGAAAAPPPPAAAHAPAPMASPADACASPASWRHQHHQHQPHHQHQGHPHPQQHQELLSRIYGDHFPWECRHALSGWIESAFAEDLDVSNNPAHGEHARALALTLVQRLEAKANADNIDYALRGKLEHTLETFKQRYNHNPLALYHVVRHCLHEEMNLLHKADMMDLECGGGGLQQAAPAAPAAASESAYAIHQQLTQLKKATEECKLEMEATRQKQEQHSLTFYKHHQVTVQLDSGQYQEQSQEYVGWKEFSDKLATQLRQSFNDLKLRTSNLAHAHLETYKQLKELQFRVLEQELNKWKREQQLSGNGAPFANNLDQIQKWCEDLAELIWLNRQYIRQLKMIHESLNIPSQEGVMNILPELSEGLSALLESLVKNSFVIEKQPPQVLKTNTRFSATVRLLVGTKLNVHMNPPIVTVDIISEAQANSLLRAGAAPKTKSAEYSSGEILNNKQTMEYHQATGQLSVSFRNMSLKKIKRAEKKGTESVMDEKFALLFWAQFPVGTGENSRNYQVCAPSLPVVVIVHGNQEPHAWATILWDNAFAEWGRQPFLVPDKVPWCQLASTLNMKFRASCGRGLNEDNLRFLASKAFRSPGYNHDFSSALMSWSQFCKEPLPDRSFTFWDWFHAVMKLTKEDLRSLWIDGAILGFVSRHEAEECLHKSENGTFLIRFSDSELGGVTVAWITVGETSGQREVAMMQPFTRKDLMIRSLPDRLSDCVQMVFLYPNIRRDLAFEKYYSNSQEAVSQRNHRHGYVRHSLMHVIQGYSSRIK